MLSLKEVGGDNQRYYRLGEDLTMYKERIGGEGASSKSEFSRSLDRKRINDVLDRHLERAAVTSSKGFSAKDSKDRHLSRSLTSVITHQDYRQDQLAMSKSKSVKVESESNSESSDGGSDLDASWISWFCNLRGNEFFCEVDEDYIQDEFNTCGLSGQVPYYDYALDLILDAESSHGDIFTEEQNELVESAAEMLYGLIHARYVLTGKGMAAMLEKYKKYEFGRCTRVYCGRHPCLPVGLSDIPRSNRVMVYCPRCEDVYYPRSKYLDNIDGAYFGTTFPHLFLMTYPHLKPQKPSQSYVPRVFGFKIHKD